MKKTYTIRSTNMFRLAIMLAFTTSLSTHAAQPIQNGDFETGSLTGWKSTSINDGMVQVARKGSCFSGNDTTQLPIKGNYAALLRSNTEGSTRSEAVLTSSAFNAGDGIAFVALSESADLIESKNPVKFEVEILDAKDDSVLIAYDFIPRVVRLANGCPSEARSEPMSAHFFSTKSFAKKQRGIKIRFRQKTAIDSYGFFTLIDQVVKFNESETPLFYGRPVATAGITATDFGTPMLDPTGSFDPDHMLYDLNYTWTIDEDDVRHFRQPCVNNVKTGQHRAVLYVSDGQHVMADAFTFSVATSYTGDPINNREFSSTDTIIALPTESTGYISNDPQCDVDFSNGESLLVDATVVVQDANVSANNPFDLNGDGEVVPISAGSTSSSESNTTDQNTDESNLSTSTENLSTNTEALTQANLSATTIIWKPISEGDGNLVVLTPDFFEELNISILSSSGDLIEQGDFVGRTNGNRPTYRFSRPGSAYSSPSILEVGSTRYLVSSPSNRVN